MAQERVQAFLERNAKYAATHKPSPPLAKLRGSTQADPVGSIVILTCADPRIIPEEFFDFTRPKACVIRNAGGRAVDSLRTLQVLDTVGNVGIVIVVHHTDCGGLTITDEDVRRRMQERNPEEAAKLYTTPDLGLFYHIGIEESVRQDVALIKKAPFLKKDVYVVGYVFDIETGLLKEVV